MARTIDTYNREWHQLAHDVLIAPLDDLNAPAWAEHALIGVFHNDNLPWTEVDQVDPSVRSNTHPGVDIATEMVEAVEGVPFQDLQFGAVSRNRAILLGARTAGKLALNIRESIAENGPVEQAVAKRLDAVAATTCGYIGAELVERVLTQDVRAEYLCYMAAGLLDAQSRVDLNGLSLADRWLENKYPRVQEFLGVQSIEGVIGTLNGIIPGSVMDLRKVAEVELKATPRMFSNILRHTGLDTIQDISLQAKTIEGRKSFALRRFPTPNLMRATRGQLIGLHTAATAQLAVNLAERKARTTGFGRDRIEPGRGSDPRLAAVQAGIKFVEIIADVSGSDKVERLSERTHALYERIMERLT